MFPNAFKLQSELFTVSSVCTFLWLCLLSTIPYPILSHLLWITVLYRASTSYINDISSICALLPRIDMHLLRSKAEQIRAVMFDPNGHTYVAQDVRGKLRWLAGRPAVWFLTYIFPLVFFLPIPTKYVLYLGAFLTIACPAASPLLSRGPTMQLEDKPLNPIANTEKIINTLCVLAPCVIIFQHSTHFALAAVVFLALYGHPILLTMLYGVPLDAVADNVAINRAMGRYAYLFLFGLAPKLFVNSLCLVFVIYQRHFKFTLEDVVLRIAHSPIDLGGVETFVGLLLVAIVSQQRASATNYFSRL